MTKIDKKTKIPTGESATEKSRDCLPEKTNNELCPAAKKCGGCQLQNMTYARQLAYKQAVVVKLFSKYVRVRPIEGMDCPYRYRNKVSAAFGTLRNGKIISGIYQSGTKRIVKTDDCLLEDADADAIAVTVRNLLGRFGLSAYDEYKKRGFLRHVLIRKGFATGQIMVVLVTTTPIFPGKNNFIKELLRLHPEITTIVQNINDSDTSMVLGKREKTLFGKGYIEDILCSKKFKISPRSFYQINPAQTKKLYEYAIAAASLDKSKTVIDAYCGVGTIGIIAADECKNVISAELNSDAVKDAVVNARLNGCKNIIFFNLDAGDFMDALARDNEKIDVVFIDPPRAGCSRKFLDSLANLKPEKIVYISCEPTTQERDAAYLVKRGFKVVSCKPFDMFPHTRHIETVVLMSRAGL